MKNEIDRLYDLIHGHMILPSELIQNAKLPNYEYVRFLSSLDGLCVESSCFTEDGRKVQFYYYFDHEDRLMKLVSYEGVHQEVLFDRAAEIEKLRLDLESKVMAETYA